jgi:hypothetical protein
MLYRSNGRATLAESILTVMPAGLPLLHVRLQTGGDDSFEYFALLVQETYWSISRWGVRRSPFLLEQHQSRYPPTPGIRSFPQAPVEEVSHAGGHQIYCFGPDSAWNTVWTRCNIPGGHLPYCPHEFFVGNLILLLPPLGRTSLFFFLAVRV